ncbi:DUF4123 domain-containing protein [Roseateles sp. BYS180W]|uniref:DUF4123 domain-containing protein n=1 Tax=Roseateles rivi TaxID=3299028 RepID=A0ABW7FS70_9BURK
MNFAWSELSEDFASSLSQWWSRHEAGRAHWVVLVDASMVEADVLAAWQRQYGMTWEPLLTEAQFVALGKYGPLVSPLAEWSEEALQSWARRCAGIPAWSLVCANRDQAQLQTALSSLARVVTADGLLLHCRFADTRVSANLLEALSEPQRQLVGSGLQQWSWPHRQGHALQTQAFAQASSDSGLLGDRPFRPPAIELTDAQYTLMLRQAEPDMVYQLLHERMPEACPDAPGGEVHQRLCHLIERARHHGLDALNELFEYVVLALAVGDDFDQHALVQPLWPSYKSSGLAFGQWAAAWPAPVWQALDKSEDATP